MADDMTEEGDETETVTPAASPAPDEDEAV